MRTRHLASLSFGLAAAVACAMGPMAAQSAAPAAAQAAQAAPSAPASVDLKVPNKKGTVKFGVIGDNGTGEREQYEIGEQLAKIQTTFPFDFVIMLGDNLYGSQNPRDFVKKFEDPYKALLARDVKFYAALGNHDNQENRFYKPWNMNGERFYTFKKDRVRFFVLDTDYLDQPQRQWIERQLRESTDDWKIAYFHHPLYSSGKTHGSSLETRATLEPIFVKNGVNVVLTGHDHFYERIKLEQGIQHFVIGSGGSLRKGDLARTDLTVKGYDQDYVFLLAEIAGDDFYYAAVSRKGQIIDSGDFKRSTTQASPKP